MNKKFLIAGEYTIIHNDVNAPKPSFGKPKMTVHIIKLSVGTENFADLVRVGCLQFDHADLIA